MKAFKTALHIFILLSIALLVSILWTGGYEIPIPGGAIKCNGLTNPLLILVGLLVLRLFLAFGVWNSLTLVVSLFLAAALAEGVLRFLDPPMALPSLKNIMEPSDILEYRLVPLLKDRRIQTNSHGLRDRERAWEKPKGIKRLLGIGDSFTFGYQVASKDCYLKQLERILNSKGRKWDVINAGVSGYNMWQYLAYFEHYGRRYHPDLVTVGLFFDDLYGEPSRAETQGGRENRYRAFKKFRLVNFIRNGTELLKYRYRFLFKASWLKSIHSRREHIKQSRNVRLLTGREDEKIFRRFEGRLKKMYLLARDIDSRFMVIFIPDVIQLYHPELQVVNGIIKEMCDRNGIEFLDMTPIFEKQGNIEKLYLIPYDAHTSPEGHALIAAEMAKRIN